MIIIVSLGTENRHKFKLFYQIVYSQFTQVCGIIQALGEVVEGERLLALII